MCTLKLRYIKLLLKGTQCSPVLVKQVRSAHSRDLKNFLRPFTGGANLSSADLFWQAMNLQSPKIAGKSQLNLTTARLEKYRQVGPPDPGRELREHKAHIPEGAHTPPHPHPPIFIFTKSYILHSTETWQIYQVKTVLKFEKDFSKFFAKLQELLQLGSARVTEISSLILAKQSCICIIFITNTELSCCTQSMEHPSLIICG